MQMPYSRRIALHSSSVLLSTSGRLTEKFTLTFAKPWPSHWNVRGSPKPELCLHKHAYKRSVKPFSEKAVHGVRGTRCVQLARLYFKEAVVVVLSLHEGTAVPVPFGREVDMDFSAQSMPS